MWGADVAELRTLAQQFGKASDSLLQQSTLLGNQINNNPSWKGQDAATFRSEWNGTHRALIQKAALALKQESKKLLENANEQEKASNTGGAGGSASGGTNPTGGPGTGRGQEGPDWLSNPDSPFRNGWDAYGLAKTFPNMRAGLFDLGAMLHKSRVGDFMDPAAWRAFQNSSEFSKFFNMSNNLFEGKFHEVLNLADNTKAFKVIDAFSKELGWAGVGLDTLDAYNGFQDGDYGSAAYSTTKALLGAGSFLPPPAGTACMVASGALAIYDNVEPVRNFVNGVGSTIADGAGAVGESVSDGVEAVGDFFGF